MYVGGAQSPEQVLHARQVRAVEKGVLIAHTNLVGAASGLERMGTPEEFPSCLDHATTFTQTQTDLNHAASSQFAVYA